MCFLVTCRLCGAEVYRREHIKRKTAQVKETIAQEAKWAWLRHAGTVGHDYRRYGVRRWNSSAIDHDGAKVLDAMVQHMWLNETMRHPDVEVGDGPVVPEGQRITTIMRVFGLTPLEGE